MPCVVGQSHSRRKGDCDNGTLVAVESHVRSHRPGQSSRIAVCYFVAASVLPPRSTFQPTIFARCFSIREACVRLTSVSGEGLDAMYSVHIKHLARPVRVLTRRPISSMDAIKRMPLLKSVYRTVAASYRRFDDLPWLFNRC